MYEEYTRESQAHAEKSHNALIQSGGRPTRSIHRDPGHWAFVEGIDDCMSEEEDDEQKELRWVMDHWGHEGSKFAVELHTWQAFRSFQRYMRKKPASLWKVQQRIDEYWKKRGIRDELKPQLQIDPQQQSKVEEWKEYYWYHHQQLPSYEKRIERAEREKEKWLQKFDAAPSETQCSDRPVGTKWLFGEWQSREKIFEISDREIERVRNDCDIHTSKFEWIEGQLPFIASECAGSDRVRKLNSSSVLFFS